MSLITQGPCSLAKAKQELTHLVFEKVNSVLSLSYQGKGAVRGWRPPKAMVWRGRAPVCREPGKEAGALPVPPPPPGFVPLGTAFRGWSWLEGLGEVVRGLNRPADHEKRPPCRLPSWSGGRCLLPGQPYLQTMDGLGLGA